MTSDKNTQNSFSKIESFEAAFFEPKFLSPPAPWAGHIPFAAWLIKTIQPRTLVELGVYSGISYLSFCQAAKEFQVPLRAWGIDSWQGDAHAGLYGKDILRELTKRHDKEYSDFSTLLQMHFDDALPLIEDKTIDLLHIDGLHTYEAVRHDFECWLPKLSDRAVVLFHDISVRRDDFGVWKLWEQLQQLYPSLSFEHSNGLGVLLVGTHVPDALRSLVDINHQWTAIKKYFSELGQRLELRVAQQDLERHVKDLENKSSSQHQWILDQDQKILALQRLENEKNVQLSQLQNALEQHEHRSIENNKLITSTASELHSEKASEEPPQAQTNKNQTLQTPLQQRDSELEKYKNLVASIEYSLQEHKSELATQLMQLSEAQAILQMRDSELLQHQTTLEKTQEALRLRESELNAQQDLLKKLEFSLLEREQQLLSSHSDQQTLRESISGYQHEVTLNQQQMREVVLQARRSTQELQAIRAKARATETELQEVYQSRSWQLTSGLRALGKQARYLRGSTWGSRFWGMSKRMRNAMRYVLSGNWRALAQRLQHVKKQAVEAQRIQQFPSQVLRCGIITTPHTLFVAHALQAALERAGLAAQIVQETDQGYPLELYFVICPQVFKFLPPGEKRIAFQMEQTVSSRWFTPDYLALLENSLAVLDYAQSNLKPLAAYGIVYPHIYFVPIGGISNYAEQIGDLQPDEHCEVLFYGDANAPRRSELLRAIGQRFKLRIVKNAFGQEMQRALAGAKVVVNLHYYEGALLETTRLYECLSLGKSVVSERAADQADHHELEKIVKFTPVGDVEALLEAITQALTEQADVSAQRQFALQCQAVVHTSQARFEFMLYRMLLARRILSYDTFESLNNDQHLNARLALSLPETVTRRQAFSELRPNDVEIFDGLRFSPGWIGCALSYKYLASMALRQGLAQLEIMEDDVVFPPNYDQRKQRVQSYLAANDGQWDVFVGVMAIVHPQTRILKVEEFEGETFITIDRMISAVCNIYTPKILERIAAWDEKNQDAEVNTIDRYLQSQGDIRAVLTLPFLVGHAEELDSSLWGFSNSHYAEMIEKAEQQLMLLVEQARISGEINS